MPEQNVLPIGPKQGPSSDGAFTYGNTVDPAITEWETLDDYANYTRDVYISDLSKGVRKIEPGDPDQHDRLLEHIAGVSYTGALKFDPEIQPQDWLAKILPNRKDSFKKAQGLYQDLGGTLDTDFNFWEEGHSTRQEQAFTDHLGKTDQYYVEYKGPDENTLLKSSEELFNLSKTDDSDALQTHIRMEKKRHELGVAATQNSTGDEGEILPFFAYNDENGKRHLSVGDTNHLQKWPSIQAAVNYALEREAIHFRDVPDIARRLMGNADGTAHTDTLANINVHNELTRAFTDGEEIKAATNKALYEEWDKWREGVGGKTTLEIKKVTQYPNQSLYEAMRPLKILLGMDSLAKDKAVIKSKGTYSQKLRLAKRDTDVNLLDIFPAALEALLGVPYDRGTGLLTLEGDRPFDHWSQELDESDLFARERRPVDDLVEHGDIQANQLNPEHILKSLRSVLGEQYSDSNLLNGAIAFAANQMNLRGQFHHFTDPDFHQHNIRQFGDMAVATPTLMGNRKFFDNALDAHPDLSETQKEQLRTYRHAWWAQTAQDHDSLLNSSPDFVSEKWFKAKAEGAAEGKKLTDILDDFLSDDENYSAVEGGLHRIAAASPDNWNSTVWGVMSAATWGDWAKFWTRKQAQVQEKMAVRKQTAALYGNDHIMVELGELATAVFQDIGLTIVLSAATTPFGAYAATAKKLSTAGYRVSGSGALKGLQNALIKGQESRVALATINNGIITRKGATGLVSKAEKMGAVTEVTAALKQLNTSMAGRLGRGVPLAVSVGLPATTRSGAAMYHTIFDSLPDYMSFEDKHSLARSGGLLGGLVTGGITAAFSLRGIGGAESLVQRTVSGRHTMEALRKLKIMGHARTASGRKVLARQVGTALREMTAIGLRQTIARGLTGVAFKKAPKLFFKYMLPEGVEEALDEFAQTYVQTSYLDTTMTTADRLGIAAHAGVLGLMMGGGVPVTVAGFRAASRKMGLGRDESDLTETAYRDTVDNIMARAEELNEASAAAKEGGAPLTASVLDENRRELLAGMPKRRVAPAEQFRMTTDVSDTRINPNTDPNTVVTVDAQTVTGTTEITLPNGETVFQVEYAPAGSSGQVLIAYTDDESVTRVGARNKTTKASKEMLTREVEARLIPDVTAEESNKILTTQEGINRAVDAFVQSNAAALKGHQIEVITDPDESTREQAGISQETYLDNADHEVYANIDQTGKIIIVVNSTNVSRVAASMPKARRGAYVKNVLVEGLVGALDYASTRDKWFKADKETRVPLLDFITADRQAIYEEMTPYERDRAASIYMGVEMKQGLSDDAQNREALVSTHVRTLIQYGLGETITEVERSLGEGRVRGGRLGIKITEKLLDILDYLRAAVKTATEVFRPIIREQITSISEKLSSYIITQLDSRNAAEIDKAVDESAREQNEQEQGTRGNKGEQGAPGLSEYTHLSSIPALELDEKGLSRLEKFWKGIVGWNTVSPEQDAQRKKEAAVEAASILGLDEGSLEFVRKGVTLVFRDTRTGEYVKLDTVHVALGDSPGGASSYNATLDDIAFIKSTNPALIHYPYGERTIKVGDGAYIVVVRQDPALGEVADFLRSGPKVEGGILKHPDLMLFQAAMDENPLFAQRLDETDSSGKNAGMVLRDSNVFITGFDLDFVTALTPENKADIARAKPEGIPLFRFTPETQARIIELENANRAFRGMPPIGLEVDTTLADEDRMRSDLDAQNTSVRSPEDSTSPEPPLPTTTDVENGGTKPVSKPERKKQVKADRIFSKVMSRLRNHFARMGVEVVEIPTPKGETHSAAFHDKTNNVIVVRPDVLKGVVKGLSRRNATAVAILVGSEESDHNFAYEALGLTEVESAINQLAGKDRQGVSPLIRMAMRYLINNQGIPNAARNTEEALSVLRLGLPKQGELPAGVEDTPQNRVRQRAAQEYIFEELLRSYSSLIRNGSATEQDYEWLLTNPGVAKHVAKYFKKMFQIRLEARRQLREDSRLSGAFHVVLARVAAEYKAAKGGYRRRPDMSLIGDPDITLGAYLSQSTQIGAGITTVSEEEEREDWLSEVDPDEVKESVSPGATVGSRSPTAKGVAGTGTNPENQVSLEALRESPEAYKKNALLVMELPIVSAKFKGTELSKTVNKYRKPVMVAEARVIQAAQNLKDKNAEAKKAVTAYLVKQEQARLKPELRKQRDEARKGYAELKKISDSNKVKQDTASKKVTRMNQSLKKHVTASVKATDNLIKKAEKDQDATRLEKLQQRRREILEKAQNQSIQAQRVVKAEKDLDSKKKIYKASAKSTRAGKSALGKAQKLVDSPKVSVKPRASEVQQVLDQATAKVESGAVLRAGEKGLSAKRQAIKKAKTASDRAKESSTEAVRKFGNQLKDLAADDSYTLNFADEVYAHLTEVTQTNLELLIQMFPQDLRKFASLWYDGANTIANRFAQQYKITLEQSATVLAVFSPQKDWYMNVALAERAMHIWNARQNAKFDSSMELRFRQRSGEPELKERKDGTLYYEGNATPVENPDGTHAEDEDGMLLFDNWDTKLAEEKMAVAKEILKRGLSGKKLKDIKAISFSLRGEEYKFSKEALQARFIRMHSEAASDPNLRDPDNFNVIRPDGAILDRKSLSETGKAIKAGWGGYIVVEKAVKVLSMKTPATGRASEEMMSVISQELGVMHKVRSFYNNIVDPSNKSGHVTMDTHAIAALLWKGLSGNSDEVSQNFGSKGTASDSFLGIRGLYPAFAEAYRSVKFIDEETGSYYLPREIQSITWEAVRLMFPAAWKRNKENIRQLNQIWNEFRDEKRDLRETQEEVFRYVQRSKGIPEESIMSIDESIESAETQRGTGIGRTDWGQAAPTEMPTDPVAQNTSVTWKVMDSKFMPLAKDPEANSEALYEIVKDASAKSEKRIPRVVGFEAPNGEYAEIIKNPSDGEIANITAPDWLADIGTPLLITPTNLYIFTREHILHHKAAKALGLKEYISGWLNKRDPRLATQGSPWTTGITISDATTAPYDNSALTAKVLEDHFGKEGLTINYYNEAIEGPWHEKESMSPVVYDWSGDVSPPSTRFALRTDRQHSQVSGTPDEYVMTPAERDIRSYSDSKWLISTEQIHPPGSGTVQDALQAVVDVRSLDEDNAPSPYAPLAQAILDNAPGRPDFPLRVPLKITSEGLPNANRFGMTLNTRESWREISSLFESVPGVIKDKATEARRSKFYMWGVTPYTVMHEFGHVVTSTAVDDIHHRVESVFRRGPDKTKPPRLDHIAWTEIKGPDLKEAYEEVVNDPSLPESSRFLLRNYLKAVDYGDKNLAKRNGTLPTDTSTYVTDTMEMWSPRGANESHFYGLGNLDEFAAETLTNTPFQRFLMSIPDPTPGNPKRNLWQSIIDFFQKFLKELGIDADIDGTLLDSALRAVMDVVHEGGAWWDAEHWSRFQGKMYTANEREATELSKTTAVADNEELLRAINDRPITQKELDEDHNIKSSDASKTQIVGTEATYANIYRDVITRLVDKGGEVRVLDWGSGRGHGTKVIDDAIRDAGHRVKVTALEPFYDSEKGVRRPDIILREPGKAIEENVKDLIISNAVLNVIPLEARVEMLDDMYTHLKEGGVLIVNTRTMKDVMKAKTAKVVGPGEVVTDKGTFQKGYTAESLKAFVETVLPDADVRINKGKDAAYKTAGGNSVAAPSVIVTKPTPAGNEATPDVQMTQVSGPPVASTKLKGSETERSTRAHNIASREAAFATDTMNFTDVAGSNPGEFLPPETLDFHINTQVNRLLYNFPTGMITERWDPGYLEMVRTKGTTADWTKQTVTQSERQEEIDKWVGNETNGGWRAVRDNFIAPNEMMHDLISDLAASLPDDVSKRDLKYGDLGVFVDPWTPLKENFKGGTKRDVNDVLKDMANVLFGMDPLTTVPAHKYGDDWDYELRMNDEGIFGKGEGYTGDWMARMFGDGASAFQDLLNLMYTIDKSSAAPLMGVNKDLFNAVSMRVHDVDWDQFNEWVSGSWDDMFGGGQATQVSGKPELTPEDKRFLELAEDEEANIEELQRMTDKRAGAAEFDTTRPLYRGFVRRPDPKNFKTLYDRATVSLTPVEEVAKLYTHSPTKFGIKQGKGATLHKYYTKFKNPLDLANLDLREDLYHLFDAAGVNYNFYPLELIRENPKRYKTSQPLFTVAELKDLLREIDDSVASWSKTEVSGGDGILGWSNLEDVIDYIRHLKWDRKNDPNGESYSEAIQYNAIASIRVDVFAVADTHTFTNHIRDLGHDAIIHPDTVEAGAEFFKKETVAGRPAEEVEGIDAEDEYRITTIRPFEMSQMKLADPVIRDKDGNVIPLSQRFDITKPSVQLTQVRGKPETSAQMTQAQDDAAGKLEAMIEAGGTTGQFTGDFPTMFKLFGSKMYNGNVGSVLIKEMAQNSFDALKGKIEEEKRKAVQEALDSGLSGLDTEGATMEDIGSSYEPAITVSTIEYGSLSPHMAAFLTGDIPDLSDTSLTEAELSEKKNENYDNDTFADKQWFYISDNGMGMTPDIINNAFFRLAGTHKDVTDASGGYGIAKMGIFGASEEIMVDTVRDGVRSTVRVLKDDLINQKPFDIKVTEAPGVESYTEVFLKFPKKVDDDKVNLTESLDALSIMHPTEKILISRYRGTNRLKYSTQAEDTYDKWARGDNRSAEAREHAATYESNRDSRGHYDSLTHDSLTPHGVEKRTFETEHANVTVFIDRLGFKDKKGIDISYAERPYIPGDGIALNGKYNVYSNGLLQFTDSVGKLNPDEMFGTGLPYFVMVDVNPKVGAHDSKYPFNNNREGWAPAGQKLKEEPNLTGGMANIIEELKGMSGKHPIHRQLLKIFNELRTKEQENLFKSEFEIIRGLGNVDPHPSQPVVYNNIDAPLSDEEQELMEGLSTAVYNGADSYLEILKGAYDNNLMPDSHKRDPRTVLSNEMKRSLVVDGTYDAETEAGGTYDNSAAYHYGAALSKNWGGAHTGKLKPFLILMNPVYADLYFNDDGSLKVTPEEYAAVLDHLIMHEVNHIDNRNEGAGFTFSLAHWFPLLAKNPTTARLIQENLANLIRDNAETFKSLRKKFAESSTRILDAELQGSGSSIARPSHVSDPDEEGRRPGEERDPDTGRGDEESDRERTSRGDVSILEAFSGRTFRVEDAQATQVSGKPDRFISREVPPEIEALAGKKVGGLYVAADAIDGGYSVLNKDAKRRARYEAAKQRLDSYLEEERSQGLPEFTYDVVVVEKNQVRFALMSSLTDPHPHVVQSLRVPHSPDSEIKQGFTKNQSVYHRMETILGSEHELYDYHKAITEFEESIGALGDFTGPDGRRETPSGSLEVWKKQLARAGVDYDQLVEGHERVKQKFLPAQQMTQVTGDPTLDPEFTEATEAWDDLLDLLDADIPVVRGEEPMTVRALQRIVYNKNKPPNWRKGGWFWKAFFGPLERNLRDYENARKHFMKSVGGVVEGYQNTLDSLIAEYYTDRGMPVDSVTISDATGATYLGASRETLEAIDEDYREEAASIVADTELTAEQKDEQLLGAFNAKEAAEDRASAAAVASARRKQRDALAKLKREAPKMVPHLASLRKLADGLSQKMGDMMGVTSPEFKLVIGRNLVVYLTKQYRQFTRPNWTEEFLNLKRHKTDRDIALNFFGKQWMNAKVEDLRESGLTKDEATAQAQLERDKADPSGRTIADKALEDFLMQYEKDFGVDSFQRQGDLDIGLRKALGEFTETTNVDNLYRTIINLSSLASKMALRNKVVDMGLKAGWLITREKQVAEAERAELTGLPSPYDKYREVYSSADTAAATELEQEFEEGKTADERQPRYTVKFDKQGQAIKPPVKRLPPADPLINYREKTEDGSVRKFGKLLAHPDVIDDIKDLLNVDAKDRSNPKGVHKVALDIEKQVAKATGLTLQAKTVGSIPFFFRQIMGNYLFLWQNGIDKDALLPSLGSQMSRQLAPAGFKGRSLTESIAADRGSMAYYAHLGGLGVTDEGVNFNLIKDLMTGRVTTEEMMLEVEKLQDPDPSFKSVLFPPGSERAQWLAAAEKALPLTLVGKGPDTPGPGAGLKIAHRKAQALVLAIDNAMKIAAYEYERATLVDARQDSIDAERDDEYRDLTERELDRMAAKIILRTQQSYSQAPPIIDFMTKTPVVRSVLAPFARFMGENPRLMVNVRRQSHAEVRSSNPVIQERGLDRRSGFRFANYVLGLMVPALSAVMAGLGPEREREFRDGYPKYSRQHSMYYFRDKFDTLYRMSLSYVHPMSPMLDSSLRGIEYIILGKPWKALMAVTVDYMFETFLNEQIMWSAVSDVLIKNEHADSGRKIMNPDSENSLSDALEYIYEKGFEPPTLTALRRIQKARGTDYPTDEDSKSFLGHSIYSPKGLLLRHLVPVKWTAVLQDELANRRFRELSENYAQTYSGKNILRWVDRGTNSKQVEQMVRKEHVQSLNALRKMRSAYRAYSVDIEEGELQDIMQGAGVPKDFLGPIEQGTIRNDEFRRRSEAFYDTVRDIVGPERAGWVRDAWYKIMNESWEENLD